MFYEEPKMDVILLQQMDVIRTSNTDPDLGDDNVGDDGVDFT